ncbi:MAG: hypothetical protein ACI9OJ_001949 [Myxococcota bacterium]|jgi:hypothetical protein
MKSLTIEVLDDGRRVIVSGSIDEFCDLEALAQVLASGESSIEVDLGQVHRINSVGVSKWIRAVRSASPNRSVRWVNVSAVMASQLTMIANFGASATVESFFAPYYCEACDAEHDVLLRTESLTSDGKAPPQACSTCQSHMVFDDVAEGYFDSLRNLANP